MKRAFATISVALFVAGCTPTRFYTNEIADAYSTSRTVSVEKIDAENTRFNVYKVNAVNYALVPSDNESQDRLGEISRALIFSDKDIEELRNTCRKIVEAYYLNPGEVMEIIEYHLVLNKVHLEGTGSTFVSGGSIDTSAQFSEVQKVAFRLQYFYQPRAVWGPQKRIDYMFYGRTGKMSVNDLKALLNDLQK